MALRQLLHRTLSVWVVVSWQLKKMARLRLPDITPWQFQQTVVTCLGFCALVSLSIVSLQWRHTWHDGVSNHQPRDCFLNRLFRHRWKKTSKLSVTGLCAGNSLVTGGFPAQRASNAENVSIWWRHHAGESGFDFEYEIFKCGLATTSMSLFSAIAVSL